MASKLSSYRPNPGQQETDFVMTSLTCIACVCVCYAGSSGGILCSVCNTQTLGRTCITNPPAPTLCRGFSACISIATLATNDGRYHCLGYYRLL